ncbi:hypothetical protein [Allocoleopsis franciscana]|uniref:Uncharacterized protein n=1 Tax=Allocoleopsis franciscana PCC 7113 TaxID=1173027 RepID=K9WAG9_9CYAN|nr:hypothetical protein [Allocoleopsis franciscana]AFZ16502.1 hypothetical protein Mic7113_0586 [Allocoleopsis franciscana PCC 7113]
MTEKEIDSSATGLLILILPIAFLIVLLFKAWPVLLALLLLSLTLRVWQKYQWQQWSNRVNPYFNQLIKENQGCLTALDLSIKANLSGSAARLFLDRKAEEFGAQRREYEGKGTVYYFLTVSSLGSLLEESEPPPELEDEDEDDIATLTPELPASELIETLTQKDSHPSHSHGESSIPGRQELLEPPIAEESVPSIEVYSTDQVELKEEVPVPPVEVSTPDQVAIEEEEPISPVEVSTTEESVSPVALTTKDPVEAHLEPLKPPQSEPTALFKEKEKLSQDAPLQNQELYKPLIQAELAKRLDVHSSTVGKRKSDEDFPEWSQSRDPEGVAWGYNPDSKEFVPLEKIPELE